MVVLPLHNIYVDMLSIILHWHKLPAFPKAQDVCVTVFMNAYLNGVGDIPGGLPCRDGRRWIQSCCNSDLARPASHLFGAHDNRDIQRFFVLCTFHKFLLCISCQFVGSCFFVLVQILFTSLNMCLWRSSFFFDKCCGVLKKVCSIESRSYLCSVASWDYCLTNILVFLRWAGCGLQEVGSSASVRPVLLILQTPFCCSLSFGALIIWIKCEAV